MAADDYRGAGFAVGQDLDGDGTTDQDANNNDIYVIEVIEDYEFVEEVEVEVVVSEEVDVLVDGEEEYIVEDIEVVTVMVPITEVVEQTTVVTGTATATRTADAP